MSGSGRLAAAALCAYAMGFAMVFVWARALHRRHGVRDPRAAVTPALLGGALGGLVVLLLTTADQLGVVDL